MSTSGDSVALADEKQTPQMPGSYSTPLIPIKNSLNGPLTTSRQQRFYYGYFILFVVGCVLLLASASPFLQTFGAGLVFPGGGFVAILMAGEFWMTVSHAALLVGSILIFFAAMCAWFFTGNMVAPIVIWLGAALLAAAMGHHQIWSGALFLVPAVPVLISAIWLVYRRKTLVKSIELREKRNAYLAESTGGAITPLDENGLPLVEELTAVDLSLMRYLLDRSLQPIDEFNGFDIIDQFQTSSLRYQISNMSYALSLCQYCRTPAFRGYLSEAQVNLIEKMKEPIIWRYWRLENAWGNLRLDGDPMAPNTDDNVMYSGWYVGMIAMYQSNTGDRRYNTPGSLTLTTPKGHEYQYDYPTVVENLLKSHSREAYTLIPCEPNFIYPMCNNYGAMAIRTEDRLNGSNNWDTLSQSFTEKIDSEFTRTDGRLDIVRSNRTGFAPPFAGQGAEIYSALFLHPVVPGAARRCWEITRQELLEVESFEDALLQLDAFDPGNYTRSRTCYAPLAACAVEMGDYTLAERLIEEHNVQNPSSESAGVLHRKSASSGVHSIECAARVGRVNGIKDCIEQGMPEEWLNGPILEQANYPEILVAKAVSDGKNLETVLYPGKEAGIFEITVAQLEPNGSYQCHGAASDQIKADDTGRIVLQVSVDGRSPLSLHVID